MKHRSARLWLPDPDRRSDQGLHSLGHGIWGTSAQLDLAGLSEVTDRAIQRGGAGLAIRLVDPPLEGEPETLDRLCAALEGAPFPVVVVVCGGMLQGANLEIALSADRVISRRPVMMTSPLTGSPHLPLGTGLARLARHAPEAAFAVLGAAPLAALPGVEIGGWAEMFGAVRRLRPSPRARMQREGWAPDAANARQVEQAYRQHLESLAREGLAMDPARQIAARWVRDAAIEAHSRREAGRLLAQARRDLSAYTLGHGADAPSPAKGQGWVCFVARTDQIPARSLAVADGVRAGVYALDLRQTERLAARCGIQVIPDPDTVAMADLVVDLGPTTFDVPLPERTWGRMSLNAVARGEPSLQCPIWPLEGSCVVVACARVLTPTERTQLALLGRRVLEAGASAEGVFEALLEHLADLSRRCAGVLEDPAPIPQALAWIGVPAAARQRPVMREPPQEAVTALIPVVKAWACDVHAHLVQERGFSARDAHTLMTEVGIYPRRWSLPTATTQDPS